MRLGTFIAEGQPYKPPGWEYACSEACVAGELSRWMARQKAGL